MSRRGWVLFGAMCLLWGIPYLMIKIAVGGVSVPVLVFLRTGIGALVLLPLAFRPGALASLRAHWRPLLAFAGLEIIGPWYLLSDAERHLSSGLTGLLIAAVPIIGVLVARGFGDTTRLGPMRWTGLGLGLAGVVLLAAPHLSGGTAWPVVELLLVAVGYATAPVIAARQLADVPNLLMTASCLGLAALVYAVPAALTWPTALPSGPVLFSLGALAVVCTALAFVLFFELIREVGPARAVVFTYVNPAVAVAAGVLLLGEPLTTAVVAAFVLILSGSVLATARQREKVPAAVVAQPCPALDSPAD
ncbi:MAG TPA: EamA family transporter [Pseudonocardia sp.]|nr:EamA family transporter [Pseudonocardia sp.]